MENLAFIHSSAAYESIEPEPERRSLDEIGAMVPSSAVMTVVGTAIAASVMVQAPDAQAVVQRGDTCSAVQSIQSALGISADGVFGPATETAVINFQRSRNLSADGIVGPSTAAQLNLTGASDTSSAYAVGRSCTSSSGGGGGGNTGTLTISTNGSALAVRSGPGASYDVTSSLANGSTASFVEASNGWYKLASGGWVSSNWVTVGSGGGGGTPGGSSSGTTSGSSGTVTIVNAPSGLRVRSSASGSSSVTGFLSNGDRVNVTGRSSNGFLELANGGWIASQYASTTASAGGGGDTSSSTTMTASAGATTYRVATNGGDLLVRSDPSNNSSVVNYLPNGSQVTVISQSNGWSSLSGGGWVVSEWLR